MCISGSPSEVCHSAPLRLRVSPSSPPGSPPPATALRARLHASSFSTACRFRSSRRLCRATALFPPPSAPLNHLNSGDAADLDVQEAAEPTEPGTDGRRHASGISCRASRHDTGPSRPSLVNSLRYSRRRFVHVNPVRSPAGREQKGRSSSLRYCAPFASLRRSQFWYPSLAK